MRLLLILLSSLCLAGCWFVFIPVGAIANALAGTNCVASSARLGDTVIYKGEPYRVVELGSEPDAACKDPRLPIRARLEARRLAAGS